MQTFDVVIVGGGIVGLSLSLLLAQETSLKIAVLEAQAGEPVWTSEFLNPRVSAISLSSKKIFEKIGIWQQIVDLRISPYDQMQVWDGITDAKISFDSRQIDQHALGYIIENNLMLYLLYQQIKQYPQIAYIAPVKLTDFKYHADQVELFAGKEKLLAKIAIAADGAQSWLRNAAHIQMSKKEYEQLAIVANVTTTEPHQQIARQIFLATGPLAFLPLSEPAISSIVWSLPKAEATKLLKLDDHAFSAKLTDAFQAELGEIIRIDQRFSFPLIKQQAKQYTKSNVILVGDAAHTVHPLAGQGLNIGLKDAQRLVEILHQEILNHRNFASAQTLRRYERASKAENFGLLTGIDFLHHLFLSDKRIIRQARAFGLKLTNRIPFLKEFFINQAY